MAKGMPSIIIGLGILSLALILVIGAIVTAFGLNQEGEEGAMSFPEAVWSALMRTLDAGTMGGDTGWPFRLVMFAVTLGGIFILSTLIGALSSGIDAKLDELRKGRSRVVERNHTVILGWSEEIYPIIEQLVIANENQRRACVVVLAERDKVEMEDDIAERLPDLRTTKVVCRTGRSTDLADLAIANIEDCKSVIILSGESENPDADAIKTVLAISNGLPPDAECSIVTEIHDPANLLPVKIASGGRAEAILVGSLIARVTAQTCRQSGLSGVYVELLDFDGDEIYYQACPELEGRPFKDALDRYPTSTVIGLVDDKGVPALNPPMDTRIGRGYKVIAIAEDDDKVQIGPEARGKVKEASIVEPKGKVDPKPETVLILGMNWRVPMVAAELDNYVAKGSSIIVASSSPGAPDAIAKTRSGLVKAAIVLKPVDVTDRAELEALPYETVDHIVVMTESDDYSESQADSRVLVTLIHLRDIMKKRGLGCSITSEILDIRNRALAEVAEADDFIISDKLVSLMLAQVSENPSLNAVFADLFDPEGSEVYMKPASDYVALGAPVNFYTVTEAAARRGHIAIGYRIEADSKDAAKAYGIRINPAKESAVAFTERDNLVVIAED
jgi:voltage-gated potassium channel Kch